MLVNVMKLAACLQALFTVQAESLGQSTGLIQRLRKLTAPRFVQTLVFQWIAKPKATVEEMARQLEISPEGLRQRFTPQAIDFLKAVLEKALANAWQAHRPPLGLLKSFTATIVEDSSVVSLPASLAAEFPGCGGREEGSGAAAFKINIRWDVSNGELLHLSVHTGRTSDKTLGSSAADVPVGGLHLADQGYFDSERWQAFGLEKYWISRVPTGTKLYARGVWQSISQFVSGLSEVVVDESVALVQQTGLVCRLVALRCPPEVANRRRQKMRESTRRRKGREPSEAQLQMCDWTLFATNVPVEKLAAKEVWLVYRCRWQIELLFKRAKQQLGLGFSWGVTGPRRMVEIYAKLIGLVVTHWATLLRGGPLAGTSLVKLFAVVANWAAALRSGLPAEVSEIALFLEKMAKEFQRVRPQAKSRKKPSTRQNMLNPRVAA